MTARPEKPSWHWLLATVAAPAFVAAGSISPFGTVGGSASVAPATPHAAPSITAATPKLAVLADDKRPDENGHTMQAAAVEMVGPKNRNEEGPAGWLATSLRLGDLPAFPNKGLLLALLGGGDMPAMGLLLGARLGELYSLWVSTKHPPIYHPEPISSGATSQLERSQLVSGELEAWLRGGRIVALYVRMSASEAGAVVAALEANSMLGFGETLTMPDGSKVRRGDSLDATVMVKRKSGKVGIVLTSKVKFDAFWAEYAATMGAPR